jgi:hypothetical protein
VTTFDQDLLTAIQFALIEPPNGGASWPSGLWTREEVLGSLNQRQDKLLKDSLLLVGIANLPVAASQHRVDLPFDWIRTISVVWRSTDLTVVRELLRADSFEADHAIPTWDLTDTTAPLVYMEYETPTLQVQIGPAPTGTGTLELLYVPLGTRLTGQNELLVVPDEWAFAVKYGALADLLSKNGRGQDLPRAASAEQKFQLGIEAARLILRGGA